MGGSLACTAGLFFSEVGHRRRMAGRTDPRGTILLEVMVALAILLMSAMTVSGIVIDSLNAMVQSRQQMQACDLARSTMAEIEAGLVDASAVNGPASRWDESRLLTPEEGDQPMRGMLPQASASESDGGDQWFLEVGTEPAGQAGLYLVTVTARLARAKSPDSDAASYTLRQIVRIGEEAEDVAGEEDELMDAARRGLGSGSGQ